MLVNLLPPLEMSATDKWLLDTGESGRNENLMRSSCFLYLEQVQKALLSLIIWLEYNWFDYAEEDAEDKEYIIDLLAQYCDRICEVLFRMPSTPITNPHLLHVLLFLGPSHDSNFFSFCNRKLETYY